MKMQKLFYYLLLFEFRICRYSVQTSQLWPIQDGDAKSSAVV